MDAQLKSLFLFILGLGLAVVASGWVLTQKALEQSASDEHSYNIFVRIILEGGQQLRALRNLVILLFLNLDCPLSRGEDPTRTSAFKISIDVEFPSSLSDPIKCARVVFK